MGWIKRFLEKLPGGDPSTEFIFVPSIPSSGVPRTGQPIHADKCYVELYLESLRLTRARRLASRFHGVVYSFVTLVREGEAKACLSAISKPEKLTELDKDSIDRVITVSKQMMAPTAYRGGPISLEFGLFSVKSGNLLTPILDYITRQRALVMSARSSLSCRC